MKVFVALKPSWAMNGFEPYISEQTMLVHWAQLHQKYVKNLNDMLKKYPNISSIPASEILRNPSAYFDNEDDKMKYVNNMGGHFCHTLFWYCINPNPSKAPPDFWKALGMNQKQLEAQLKANGLSRFGSGWSWLALKHENTPDCYSTQNHFTPFMKLHTPILCVDLWEHAYFLDRFGNRQEWLDIILQFVDWQKVSNIYQSCIKGKGHPIDKMLVGN